MNAIVIDFETYFDASYTLKKLSIAEYVHDPRFHVQATARDLIVEAVLRLEAHGLPVMFHVHDEVIVEVPEEAAEDAAHRVEATMNEIPAWANGLPIACEVSVSDRYGK